MSIGQVLVVQGCLSAIIFALVLFTISVNRAPNRFLALLILSLSLNLALAWILKEGIYNDYPELHWLPYGIAFGLAPLLYRYVWSICKSEKPNYWHLLWLLADYPHSIYHLIFGRMALHLSVHEFLDKWGFVSVVVMAYYLWRSRKIIIEYQKELPHKLSNTEHQTLKWMKQLTTLFLVSIPVSIVFWILVVTTDFDFNDRTIAYAFQVLAIFWLGIGGSRQPEVTSKKLGALRQPPLVPVPVKSDHLKLLIDSMEHDKLYLVPDLNVRFLEERLNLTAKQISEALNQGLEKNFYSFINEYRVNEFKKRSKEKTHLTLAGLAMECGFNSKTTFQRVFKEITGQRPSEFLQSERD